MTHHGRVCDGHWQCLPVCMHVIILSQILVQINCCILLVSLSLCIGPTCTCVAHVLCVKFGELGVWGDQGLCGFKCQVFGFTEISRFILGIFFAPRTCVPTSRMVHPRVKNPDPLVTCQVDLVGCAVHMMSGS